MTIDYDLIANYYDIYANTDYDIEFFKGEISGRQRVLELTSGTGRLSIPLIEAGANVTCLDISAEMLKILEKKMRQKKLHAEVVCMDLLKIDYNNLFDLAIFPFQSFMEILGKENQAEALNRIYRSLMPGGTFICTMHNPVVRKKSVDGVLRYVGHFPMEDGTLSVSGVETGGKPIVDRHQYFELYDKTGKMYDKRILRMQFELIDKNEFAAMAKTAGFRIVNLYGNYDRSTFIDETSPVMIWILGKEGIEGRVSRGRVR